MMPLTLASVGEENMIKKVGGSPETRKFLESLGFVAGGSVTVVSEIAGNVIVNVKESRVAVSKEMAAKIMVWRPDPRVGLLYKIRRKVCMATLRDAKVGETVTVKKLTGEGAVKRRIMDMGITKGTEIYIRKVAPLGDPVEVTVRGYELSLRKADAEMVEI